MISALLKLLSSFGHSRAAGVKPLPVAENFQPERYAGRWYELARTPNWFEKGLHSVTADYLPQSDGRFTVLNAGVDRKGRRREARGIAEFTGSRDRGALRVSFFRPFYGDYRVLFTDYDRYAVVAGGSERLWILSRTPMLPLPMLEELFSKIRRCGYTLNRLEFPLQEI